MRSPKKHFSTIDEYISTFPKDVQRILKSVRTTIRTAAPDAKEGIAYRIPTFRQNGNLVHFAAFTKHIGFYPTASGVAHFKDELTQYKTAKGSIQFPLSEPIPHALIKKITAFRLNENLEKHGKQ